MALVFLWLHSFDSDGRHARGMKGGRQPVTALNMFCTRQHSFFAIHHFGVSSKAISCELCILLLQRWCSQMTGHRQTREKRLPLSMSCGKCRKIKLVHMIAYYTAADEKLLFNIYLQYILVFNHLLSVRSISCFRRASRFLGIEDGTL